MLHMVGPCHMLMIPLNFSPRIKTQKGAHHNKDKSVAITTKKG